MGAPVGGMFISSFGGAIGFRRWENLLPSAGSLTIQPSNLLDVARWELKRAAFHDDTTHTGSWGSQGVDVPCMGFNAAAEVIWDLLNPPNFLVENGGQFVSEAALDYGYKVWFYVGSGVNYPNDNAPYFFFSPSAKVTAHQTEIDAGGKKKVRARIDIIGNAPLFAMGGTLNEQAKLDRYIAHCITRGWTW